MDLVKWTTMNIYKYQQIKQYLQHLYNKFPPHGVIRCAVVRHETVISSSESISLSSSCARTVVRCMEGCVLTGLEDLLDRGLPIGDTDCSLSKKLFSPDWDFASSASRTSLRSGLGLLLFGKVDSLVPPVERSSRSLEFRHFMRRFWNQILTCGEQETHFLTHSYRIIYLSGLNYFIKCNGKFITGIDRHSHK